MQNKNLNFNHRRARGSQHAHAKLTENDVVKIRDDYYNDGTTMNQLAEDYGVTAPTIWNIIHEKTWRHTLDEQEDEYVAGEGPGRSRA